MKAKEKKKEFTKSDLNNGMIVKLRNGRLYLKLGARLVAKDEYCELYWYSEDLTLEGLSENTGHNIYDIIAAYEVTSGRVTELSDIFIKENLVQIWERKEPIKITIQELLNKLEKLTGETYVLIP